MQLRRLHFHDFMLEVHSQLRNFTSQADPLVQVADAAVAGMRVLCLDELFVTDVADAAILNRLFGRMWDKGLVLVATSNRCGATILVAWTLSALSSIQSQRASCCACAAS